MVNFREKGSLLGTFGNIAIRIGKYIGVCDVTPCKRIGNEPSIVISGGGGSAVWTGTRYCKNCFMDLVNAIPVDLIMEREDVKAGIADKVSEGINKASKALIAKHDAVQQEWFKEQQKLNEEILDAKYQNELLEDTKFAIFMALENRKAAEIASVLVGLGIKGSGHLSKPDMINKLKEVLGCDTD